MRFPRGLGLVALYIGALGVALLLALPFRAAGLAASSNPNSATGPIFIIVIIVAAPIGILLVARLSNGIAALRAVILLAIAGSLLVTMYAALSIVLPPPTPIPPYSTAQVFDAALIAASCLSVLLFLGLLMEPQWYLVDAVGFLAAGALAAVLGISFGILPTFILLIALAIYDAIAVYGTKHMVSLADVVTQMRLPILMVMPSAPGYDYTRAPSLKVQRQAPVEEREALFMGLGDVVIPGTLVVSSYVFLPAVRLAGGLGANLVVAIAALVGSLVGYAVLMILVGRGNPQAGLPLLNGGALAGYIVSYLVLFHSLSLGFSLQF
ncbi:MAG TPA: presenilin family intramembrane aspartyl protease PSH [Thermoplasmata archaeon]|nr:presenilin family intramembrane aspartyl protease PSH [Thermoplasmata archaeon]